MNCKAKTTELPDTCKDSSGFVTRDEYKKLALAIHPNRNPGCTEEATEKFKILNNCKDNMDNLQLSETKPSTQNPTRPTQTPTQTQNTESISQPILNSTSAMVVPIAILIYSLCQTNQPKEAGVVYMVLLIIFVCLRSLVFKQLMNNGEFSLKLKGRGCLSDLPLLGISPSVDVFVAVYSFTYAFIPMIQQGYNPLILIILGIYSLFNITLKFNCYTIEMLIGDIMFAMLSGVASVFLLSAVFSLLNSKPGYLFISSVPSNGEYCSMPTKQKMVCSVYKNGELVTKTNS